MKFTAALVSIFAATQAVSLESDAEANPVGPQGHPGGVNGYVDDVHAQAVAHAQGHAHHGPVSHPNIPYEGDSYYHNPGYVEPDYSKKYDETLPGADFNRQVYEFNTDKGIWDQNDYTERVKVEAEMLVALEALKENTMYLGYDIQELQDHIAI